MRRRGISASSEAEAEPPSLKGPQKADDVDPFFPLAVAANALAGFPGPARAYPIAAERMPRRPRRAPLHPHHKPRDDPGRAATGPAAIEKELSLAGRVSREHRTRGAVFRHCGNRTSRR